MSRKKWEIAQILGLWNLDYHRGEDNPVKLLIQVKVIVVISVNSLVLNHGKKYIKVMSKSEII